MKTLVKLSVLLILVCLSISAASAQQKSARKSRPASTTICKVGSVPKGMVIVGYKTNAACAEGMELVVKRPAEFETVCTDSPIPDGYAVGGMQASPACQNGNSNPLTNALAIVNADAAPVPVSRVNVSRSNNAPLARGSDSPQSQLVEERAKQVNAESRRVYLSMHGSITVGMTMAQVTKALGRNHSSRRTTRSETGTETLWIYSGRDDDLYVRFNDDNTLSSFTYVRSQSAPGK